MTKPKCPSRVGRIARTLILAALGVAALAIGCGNDDGATPTNTGQSCSAVGQCYPGLDATKLEGEAVCLDRVEGGYCTHHCEQDTDCCAVPGECPGNHPQVCGPFESTGEMYCFLSCEKEDFAGTTIDDADVYCQSYAGAAFHCRSTGGGSANRKVCVP